VQSVPLVQVILVVGPNVVPVEQVNFPQQVPDVKLVPQINSAVGLHLHAQIVLVDIIVQQVQLHIPLAHYVRRVHIGQDPHVSIVLQISTVRRRQLHAQIVIRENLVPRGLHRA
jgi:hypothetical protein